MPVWYRRRVKKERRTRRGAAAYIWNYEVKPEKINAFRNAYGPRGAWYEFFSQSSDYLGTDFYENGQAPGRFVTIDYFANAEAGPRLVAREQSAFDKIDKAWEAATMDETYIGEMTVSTSA